MASAREKILVISPNWVGDAIMAQPLLARLREKYPDATIDVVAPASIAPVWRAVSEVDEVIPTPFKHGRLDLAERWAFSKELKKKHYTRSYVLPNTIKFALLPFFAGVDKRIGYLGESRYGLLNVIHHNDKKKPRPMAAFYAALADDPSPKSPEGPFVPVMSVTKEEQQAVLEKFGLIGKKPLVTFAPGAEYGPAKMWPPERYAALAEMLLEDEPETVICLLGSPNDADVCGKIHDLCPGCVNLAGQTTLSEAFALVSVADLMITNDSGLMHVAAAFETPLVAVYGSTDYRHTPPLSSNSRIVSLNLPCSPCQKRQCPLKHHRCMRDLSEDLVYEEIAVFKGLPFAHHETEGLPCAGSCGNGEEQGTP